MRATASLLPVSPRLAHLKPLCALLIGCWLGVGASVAPAAIIGGDPQSAFSDNGANSAPSIDIQNRPGAEAFTNVSFGGGAEGLKKLGQTARDAIKKYPESGLAHEVLGTALFYSGDMKGAREEFSIATRLEPQQVGPWVKLGITQMESESLDQAETSFQKALSLKPDNRIANQRLGLLYEYQKKYTAAIEYLQKGLKGTGNNYLGVAPNLAQLLNRQKRYKEAIDSLAPRAPLTLTDPIVHIILAASYSGAQQFDKASERYARAVELQPDSKEYQLGLAISQREGKQLTAAADTLKKLIAKNPGWRPAYLEQGELALAAGKISDAEAAFDSAISTGADAASVDYKLAQYYVAQKQTKEAIARLRKGIDKGAVQPETYAMLAELERSQNNVDAGLTALRAGIAKFPQNGLLQFRLGSELAALRRYDESLPYFDKALQLKPQDADILRSYSLVQSKSGKTADAAATAGKLYKVRGEQTPEALFYATLLQQDKQLAEAATVYQKILAQEPGNLVALNNFASLLAEQGKLDEAEKAARKANELSKGNAQLLDTLGWILYQQKRYKESLEVLTDATKAKPDIAVVHYHTGVVQTAIGNTNAAKKSLEQALKLDGNSYWSADARQRLVANP